MAKQARYSIGELADLAGVSVRTLRLYEELGLVVSARKANGYRSYSAADARRLAQVLAMKGCGLPLATIGELLEGDSEDELSAALACHLAKLQEQREELEEAIRHTQAAMARVKGMRDMGTEQAFEDMKRRRVEEADVRYGAEARKRYGEEAVDAANGRLLGMDRQAWDDRERLEQEILQRLAVALEKGDARGAQARELVAMHRRWVGLHWGCEPAPEAYVGLAHGYLADERFVRYYDSVAGDGATAFLVEAIEAVME